jgi:hypothetical protein
MKIKNLSNEITTPKKLAEDVIYFYLSGIFYTENAELDNLTPRQRDQVEKQMMKIITRISKLLQYEPPSF